MNVDIVTMAVKKLENLKDLFTKTVQENKQLESDTCNWLNLKKIWLKSCNNKKTEGEYKGWTKDINSVRAVTNTLAPSLGLEEEGTKTIEDLKRQMVLLEEANIKLFNEKI